MAGLSSEGALSISWHDSSWIPVLNPTNIMDYFCERTNPFYDKTCNNEMVKMQRLGPEQLNNMAGVEYILLHVQEPILYVIRKQHRQSPTQVMALADYYIIAGVVYQAPDLCSVLNSRLLNAINSLQSAFDETQLFSKYNPSKGYWWNFKDKEATDKLLNKDKKKKEEPSSSFQRQRVDELLSELSKKFPPKYPSTPPVDKPVPEDVTSTTPGAAAAPVIREIKTEVKQEKLDDKSSITSSQSGSVKPPAEKKPKLMR